MLMLYNPQINHSNHTLTLNEIFIQLGCILGGIMRPTEPFQLVANASPTAMVLTLVLRMLMSVFFIMEVLDNGLYFFFRPLEHIWSSHIFNRSVLLDCFVCTMRFMVMMMVVLINNCVIFFLDPFNGTRCFPIRFALPLALLSRCTLKNIHIKCFDGGIMSALPQWIVNRPPISLTYVGIVIVNWRRSSANLSRKSLRETTITGCFQI